MAFKCFENPLQKLSIDDLDKKLFLENYLKNLDKQKLFYWPELKSLSRVSPLFNIS